MSIHVPPPRGRLLTDAEIDAEIARSLGPTFMSARPDGDGPGMKKALAAFEDHARRWVQARRDTLVETGSDEQPVRDTRLDLALAPDTRRSPTGGRL